MWRFLFPPGEEFLDFLIEPLQLHQSADFFWKSALRSSSIISRRSGSERDQRCFSHPEINPSVESRPLASRAEGEQRFCISLKAKSADLLQTRALSPLRVSVKHQSELFPEPSRGRPAAAEALESLKHLLVGKCWLRLVLTSSP